MNEGLHISFFGRPDPKAGCVEGTRNGPVYQGVFWLDTHEYTGVYPNSNQQWGPMSSDECKHQGWIGYSFASVDNQDSGGIGLYTHTGPKFTNSSSAFFQPYLGTGDNYGVNPNIAGTFATFRNRTFSTPVGEYTLPFSGNSSDNDTVRFALQTYQEVVKFHLEDESEQQIRQEFAVNLYNPQCQASNKVEKTCQIQIVFINALKGKSSDSRYAHTYFDDAQGGIAIFYSKLDNGGKTRMIKDRAGNEYPAFRSWANETKSEAWSGPLRFQPEVSFNQFLNMLKVATSNALNKNDASLVTSSEIDSIFGPNYNDRMNWRVLDVGFGHEIRNPLWEASKAYIGGNVTQLSVIALP